MNLSSLNNLTENELTNYAMNIKTNNEMFILLINRFVNLLDEKNDEISRITDILENVENIKDDLVSAMGKLV